MSAIEFLTKAIEFDVAGRRSEALKLYRSGINELLQTCKCKYIQTVAGFSCINLVAFSPAETDESRKQHYRTKINEYMVRAEQLKRLLPNVQGTVIDKIFIMEGDTGKSYESVFGKYLDDGVTEVQLDEPYLREHYQLTNLVRFCELLVVKCRNLKLISVTTSMKDETPAGEQNKRDHITAIEDLTKSLRSVRQIKLEIRYSENLHDRQIM